MNAWATCSRLSSRHCQASGALTVSGDVVTIDDVLKLVEDAMRGAGFDVPFESLRLVKEGE